MRLSQKIEKLGSSETLESALNHFLRATVPRRPGRRLNPDRLIRSIDAEGFAAIRQRYAIENPGVAWPKYFDLPRWMTLNLRQVRALRLDSGTRKRILDLGCGTGYFLYICQWLGHDVLGLDTAEIPMFGEMTGLLGLKRVTCRVEPFCHLPRLGKKFDLITAFMICFNGHNRSGLWTRDEWSFFLNDLETQLEPGGRICLGFNREKDGQFYSDDLHRFFISRGAKFTQNLMVLSPTQRVMGRNLR